ncbi:MAG TPA: 5'-nucleotidase [Pedobacter sp.]|nr:5'-nucleotidase [Pedobacter sp.]
MRQFHKFSYYLLVTFFFGACASGYQIKRSARTTYIINTELAADSVVIKSYTPYKVKIDAEMGRVIGSSVIVMSKKQSDTLPESPLSNFFADAIMQEARQIDGPIDFAMPSTKGGLRVDLPSGDITVSNIFELMPFENQLIVFTLKGEDVQRLLDFIAAAKGEPVSALKMTIKDKKPVNILVGGVPFDVNKTYRVLTTDYISGGGDGTKGFEKPLEKKVLGLKVRDALMNYVKAAGAAGKKIESKMDGRIGFE